MYPKKHTVLLGRFIVVCFLFLSCVYNAGHFLMDTSMNTIPLTNMGSAAGDTKPDTEEETRLVRVLSEQQHCQSPVRTVQTRERLLKASANGSWEAMRGRTQALLVDDAFLKKPYYYTFLFRHNLF
jgi:hypothetical protein